jgi:hypothetical protein
MCVYCAGGLRVRNVNSGLRKKFWGVCVTCMSVLVPTCEGVAKIANYRVRALPLTFCPFFSYAALGIGKTVLSLVLKYFLWIPFVCIEMMSGWRKSPEIDLGLNMKMISRYQSGQSFMLDGIRWEN